MKRTRRSGERVAELLVEPVTDGVNAGPTRRISRDYMIAFNCYHHSSLGSGRLVAGSPVRIRTLVHDEGKTTGYRQS